MVRVGQAKKGDLFILPVLSEGSRRIGSYGQDFCPPASELLIIISQARQLRAAVGSHKTAQERQDNRFASEIG
jgi:hypothetical protein